MRLCHAIRALACALLILSLPLPCAGQTKEAEGGAGASIREGAVRRGSSRVASVSLMVPEGFQADDIAKLISIRPGDPLSRREAARSAALIYATGRAADVSVFVSDAPSGGKDVVFRLLERRFIPAGQIRFEGNVRLSSDKLFKSLRFEENRFEYYPENIARISQVLQKAYERVGYNGVTIRHRIERPDPETERLVLSIDEGTPSRLTAISFAGRPGFGSEELAGILGLKLGDVLDKDLLKRGIEQLKKHYRSRGYFMARFGQPDIRIAESGDAALQIPIHAGMPISISFRGQRFFSESELSAFLNYSGEERMTDGFRDELAERLRSALRLAGFPDAKVTHSFRFLRNAQRGLAVFSIEEGEPLRIKEVIFKGNRHQESSVLREELFDALRDAAEAIEQPEPVNGAFIVGGPDNARPTRRPLVVPEELYLEQVYREYAARIRARYMEDGFLKVEVRPHVLTRDEEARTGSVLFEIREGVRTFVQELDIKALPEGVTAKQVNAAMALAVGQPFSAGRMSASKSGAARALQSAGYLYAGVQEHVEFTDDGKKAHVYFDIVPGPRVRLGRIVIRGHERTSEDVIRAALAVREGGILTQEAMLQSQRTLVRLGIFRTVRVSMESPDLPEPVKDLTVRLEERNTWLVSFGVGYSLMDGARIMAEAAKINLFGQALQLQLQGKLNFLKLSPLPGVRDAQDGLDAIGRKINLGLAYPHAFWMQPLDVTLRTNLLHEYLLRTSYTFQRTAAIVGADFAWEKHLSFSLQYEIEEDIMHHLNTDGSDSARTGSSLDKKLLRFEEGRVYLHSIKPIIKLDFRDNAIAPRKGILLSTQVELVQSLSSPEKISAFLFLKLQGQASAYIPLPARSVLALSVSAGKVFHLENDGEDHLAIVPKRYFVGGAASMRGFMDDALVPEDVRRALHDQQWSGDYMSEGGELFTLAKAEIRIPIGRTQFELAIFFDAGNLWLDQKAFEPWTLRYSSGAGIRMLTPIGPAALDLGINLNPDKSIGESRFVPHFSIGMF